MTLNFKIREEDALALNEQFLRGSPSHQKMRARQRWALPCVMLVLLLFTGFSRGFKLSSTLLCAGVAAAWFVIYPKRMDALVRKCVGRQMAESSYPKSFGTCELTISEEGMHSISPLGSALYGWSGVDRAELTPEYLFIFLAGPLGYPIRRSEVGSDVAEAAYEYVASRCNRAAAKDSNQEVRKPA
mgnify:CR=1 FL=1